MSERLCSLSCSILAQELPHQLGRALGLFRGKIGMDSAVSIRAVGLLDEVLYLGE
jgi:hypothetical protein